MAEFKPTPAQRTVIETRKKNLLVSAAAGSGKTKVLIHRIVDLVEHGELDVSNLVVVTFTKDAAAELRRRLYEEFTGRSGESPLLARQAMLLGSAQISTIHSFCFSLVQEYKKELGLSGRIRICDESEAGLFLHESAEEEIEARLSGEKDELFAAFYEFFADSRDDRKLVELLESLHLSADSYPGRIGFLKEKAEERRAERDRLAAGGSFAETLPGQKSIGFVRKALKGQIARLEAYSAAVLPDFAFIAEDPMNAMLAARRAALVTLGAGNTEKAFADLLAADAAAAPLLPDGRKKPAKDLPKEIKPAYARIRSGALALAGEISKLRERFLISDREALEDYEASVRILDALIPVLEGIGRRYAEKKRERGLLDYADLEHFVLELTAKPDGSPTEAAKHIAEGIGAVFVDEYQDTNLVQDRIFHAIALKDNLFIVGDPKQSVYRFRGADPGIFTGMKNALPEVDPEDPSQKSAKVLLSDNFRCDNSVIRYTNEVFRTVMDASAPGSLYGEEDELVPAKLTELQEDHPCEWIFVRKDFTSPAAAPDKDVTAESEAVAEEISAILRGKIKKKDGSLYRASDIAVLCRNKTHFPDLCESLARRGIAGSVAENDGILTEPETLFATSFLAILENPMDDVSLIGVLSSPVFRFSSDDLYGVRLAWRELRFWSALSRYAEEKNDETAEKARAFLGVFFSLLEKSKALPLQELIWTIYETLSVREKYAAAGTACDARGYLMDAARDFETFSLRSIPAFLDYLANSRPSCSARRKAESVTVQSMHKSKGLEYPIVFASFLGTEFNDSDEKKRVILSGDLGAIPLVPRLGGEVRWKSCLYRLATEEMRAEALEEEKRVLYVAMTRAQSKLYLTASSGRSKLSTKYAGACLDLAPLPGDALQSVVRASGSHLDLLLAAAHKNETLLRALAVGAELEENSKAGEIAALAPFEGEGIAVSFRGAVEVTSAGAAAPEEARAVFDPEELKENLAFVYEDDGRTLLPKKLSVSEILARGREEEEDLLPRTLLDFQNGKLKNSAAFVGTSMHEVMQFARFDAAAYDLSAELDRLLSEGYLTREAYDCLDREKLAAFFRSPFYKRLAASPKVVHEKRFNVLLDGKELIGKPGDVLVQGVIDVYFEKPDGSICIADFKTDRVRDPEGEAILRERHGEQLRLYARAVEEITRRPVTELLLYSFSLGRTVPVDRSVS